MTDFSAAATVEDIDIPNRFSFSNTKTDNTGYALRKIVIREMYQNIEWYTSYKFPRNYLIARGSK